jgi:hypothetical protein
LAVRGFSRNRVNEPPVVLTTRGAHGVGQGQLFQPAAGEEFAAPASLRAFASPSRLGQGTDVSITQRVSTLPRARRGSPVPHRPHAPPCLRHAPVLGRIRPSEHSETARAHGRQTTMTYANVLNRAGKGVRSPVDALWAWLYFMCIGPDSIPVGARAPRGEQRSAPARSPTLAAGDAGPT